MSLKQFPGSILLVLALAGCSESPEPKGETPPVSPPPEAEHAVAPTTVTADKGEAIYRLYCAACHEPGEQYPATRLLAEKFGPEKSVIRDRPDLTEEYVKTIVRSGLLEMPPFRPTEISDADLNVLAAYIVAD